MINPATVDKNNYHKRYRHIISGYIYYFTIDDGYAYRDIQGQTCYCPGEKDSLFNALTSKLRLSEWEEIGPKVTKKYIKGM